jgi:hypothetical protein
MRSSLTGIFAAAVLLLLFGGIPRPIAAAENKGAIESVTKTPGLVAFWTFGEPAGSPRLSIGTPAEHPLTEIGGPIARVNEGIYSGHSAELNGQQYFRILYADTGDLNISGPQAQVSMFAVVRITDLKQSRTIAGMWSEGRGANDDSGTRQYALLMNMPSYGGRNQLTPHISNEGGVTRRADGSAFPWCVDYAATRQEVPTDQWCTLASTYDAKYIRAYINGKFDTRPLEAEKDNRSDPYFTRGGPGGADRGMNPYYHGRGIFRLDPEEARSGRRHGSDFLVGARFALGNLKQATKGRFAGLAVFSRALTDAEINRLHQATGIAR